MPFVLLRDPVPFFSTKRSVISPSCKDFLSPRTQSRKFYNFWNRYVCCKKNYRKNSFYECLWHKKQKEFEHFLKDTYVIIAWCCKSRLLQIFSFSWCSLLDKIYTIMITYFEKFCTMFFGKSLSVYTVRFSEKNTYFLIKGHS